jgi:hypothetical protein
LSFVSALLWRHTAGGSGGGRQLLPEVAVGGLELRDAFLVRLRELPQRPDLLQRPFEPLLRIPAPC